MIMPSSTDPKFDKLFSNLRKASGPLNIRDSDWFYSSGPGGKIDVAKLISKAKFTYNAKADSPEFKAAAAALMNEYGVIFDNGSYRYSDGKAVDISEYGELPERPPEPAKKYVVGDNPFRLSNVIYANEKRSSGHQGIGKIVHRNSYSDELFNKYKDATREDVIGWDEWVSYEDTSMNNMEFVHLNKCQAIIVDQEFLSKWIEYKIKTLAHLEPARKKLSEYKIYLKRHEIQKTDRMSRGYEASEVDAKIEKLSIEIARIELSMVMSVHGYYRLYRSFPKPPKNAITIWFEENQDRSIPTNDLLKELVAVFKNNGCDVSSRMYITAQKMIDNNGKNKHAVYDAMCYLWNCHIQILMRKPKDYFVEAMKATEPSATESKI